MSILSAIANPWKIATAGAGAVILVMTVMLGILYLDNAHLTKLSNKLDDQIHNPVTGYVAVIAKKDANYGALQTAADHQSQALKDLAAADARRLAETEAKLEAAQRELLTTQKQVAVFLSKPPQGNTVCEQYDDVDRRALETLK